MYILEIRQIEPKLSLRFNVDVIAIPPWLGSHDSLKFYPTAHEKGGWKLELVSIGKSHFTTISSSWQLLFWKLSLAIFHPQNRHSSNNQLLTNCFSSNTFLTNNMTAVSGTSTTWSMSISSIFCICILIMPKKSVGSRTDQPEWTMLSGRMNTCKTKKQMKGCTGGGPVGGASDA